MLNRFSMRRMSLISGGLALLLTGGLALTGCEQATKGVKDATSNAVTTAAQTALAPAVNPVLDLLKKGEAEVKAGNLAAAAASMGGFQAVWEKAAPVIQPLAGDQWPAIESAANTVLQTFGGGRPDAATASSALSGLIGPLGGLIGQ